MRYRTSRARKFGTFPLAALQKLLHQLLVVPEGNGGRLWHIAAQANRPVSARCGRRGKLSSVGVFHAILLRRLWKLAVGVT